MRTKRQVARQRGLLAVGLVMLGVVLALGWRQLRHPRAGLPVPVEQLLLECVAPAINAAGRLRNAATPDAATPADPLTPVGTARLRALEEENRRLRALLALRDRLPAGAVAAEVTGRHEVPWQGMLIVDKGSADGVTPRMVALAPEGVVGEVMTVAPHSAKLLPLTDPACGIGAMTARASVTGVLKGDRDGRCRLIYLTGEADVRAGDAVITSGLGGLYPRGLPLGQVTRITHDPTLSSRVAAVAPAVDLAKVEMVVLITRPE